MERISKDSVKIIIPSLLDTPEFRVAWNDWIEYRMGARKKLINPEATFKMHLRKLESFGHAGAILAIETAINKGWQGIFEVKPYTPVCQKTVVTNHEENLRILAEQKRNSFPAVIVKFPVEATR